jgi:polyhydroxyalkanoate synthesis repressor PhaR
MAESPPVTPPVTNDTVPQHPPVVVKKYANRRLYNTETSSYITLENLAEMVRLGRDFVVYDAKSSDDITRSVLTQIIVEEESKGTSMLPTNFLRQLIGFYGDSLQGVVPRYLESAMSNFARQQQQMRQVMQQTFSPFLPMGVEEMGRQNIALMERAMAMFNPFAPKPSEQAVAEPTHQPPAAPVSEPGPAPEVDAMRHEIEALRAQLAIARAESVMAQSLSHVAPSPDPVKIPMADPKPATELTAAPAALSVPRKLRTGPKKA